MSPVRIVFHGGGSTRLMSERHSPIIYPLSNGCTFYLPDKDLTALCLLPFHTLSTLSVEAAIPHTGYWFQMEGQIQELLKK